MWWHAFSPELHVQCQHQWELPSTMPLPHLEVNGQSVWQKGVARHLTILWPDWRSGDLRKLPVSLSRASSSFHVVLSSSWNWVLVQSPFHDSSWKRGQDWAAHHLTGPLSFLLVRGRRAQPPFFHQSSPSLIGTCLSNKSHTVVKPCSVASLHELNFPAGYKEIYEVWITNISSSSRFPRGLGVVGGESLGKQGKGQRLQNHQVVR